MTEEALLILVNDEAIRLQLEEGRPQARGIQSTQVKALINILAPLLEQKNTT